MKQSCNKKEKQNKYFLREKTRKKIKVEKHFSNLIFFKHLKIETNENI